MITGVDFLFVQHMNHAHDLECGDTATTLFVTGGVLNMERHVL